MRAFFEVVGRDIAEAKAAGDPAGLAEPLEKALGDLQARDDVACQNGMADPNNAGAGAYAYMQLMGLVASAGCGSRWPAVSDRLQDDAGEDRALPRGQAGHRALLRRRANWSRRARCGARSRPAPTA